MYKIKGKHGLKLLKDRCLKVPALKLILFAFIPLFVFFITISIESIVGSFNFNSFIIENNLYTIDSVIILLIPSFSYGILEEIGWRGYLLPKLQNKYNALISTLITTVIWYLWHIPFFFYRFDIFFALFAMFPLMLPGSITFTFLFNESKGSVLAVMIMHVTYDLVSANSTGIAPVVMSFVYIAISIIALIKYGWTNLSSKEKAIIPFA